MMLKKTVSYICDLKQSDGIVDVMDFIDNLELNFTQEELNCVIENVYEIGEYVAEDTSMDVINSEKTPFDKIGEPEIEPMWDKDDYHVDVTRVVASNFFDSTVARKIGEYDRQVDIDYSAIDAFFGGKPEIYIHFNGYLTGGNDTRDEAAAKWFVSSELAWKNGNKEEAYKYLGFALHPLQDKEAHGQIGRGLKRPQHAIDLLGQNINKADELYGWEWTDSNRVALKSVPGSVVRYVAATNVTKEYLGKYAKILK